MRHALALALACLPAIAAAEPIPGLEGARLLPGWTQPDGSRMTALELSLSPGWKTYWRTPGDSGLPPSFDWHGAGTGAQPLWPAPEVIDSGGERTLGYHDRLLLPVLLPDAPGPLTLTVEFGLCDNVCVPAEVTVTADAPATTPDPLIEAALAARPETGAVRPDCRLTDLADGVQLAATLPHDGAAPDVAMELEGDDSVWVSAPQVTTAAGQLTATADFVAPSGEPFPLDTGALRLTLIGPEGATETLGCTG